MTAVATVSNKRTRKEWAEIINADWRKSIESVLATARHLAEAKEELGERDFYEMVREDLDFSPNVARRLIKIVNDPRIANLASTPSLPASWAVLRQIGELSDDDFAWAKERGLITQNTSLRGAAAIKGARGTPEGDVWGQDRKPSTLPKPSEARTIARESNRGVAASDGNIYFGTTEEEDQQTEENRQLIYKARYAISHLASIDMAPEEWLERASHWQLWRPEEERQIYDALEWLSKLVDAWEARRG